MPVAEGEQITFVEEGTYRWVGTGQRLAQPCEVTPHEETKEVMFAEVERGSGRDRDAD